jgi:hypothetical protein
VKRDDWPLPDPKGQSEHIVAGIVDDIEARVRAFISTQI